MSNRKYEKPALCDSSGNDIREGQGAPAPSCKAGNINANRCIPGTSAGGPCANGTVRVNCRSGPTIRPS